LLSKYGLSRVESLLIAGRSVPSQPIQGAFDIMVFVPELSIRWKAFQTLLAYCLPALLGVAWSSWKTFRTIRRDDLDPPAEIIRNGLLAFSGAWFAWYLFMGMFWDRYAFQANFIGCIFGSALLYDLSHGFNLRWVKEQVVALLSIHSGEKMDLRILVTRFTCLALIFWATFSLIFTLLLQLLLHAPQSMISTKQVADFLNNTANEDTLIETYESELFFYLNCKYHYPPDQISLELPRRKYFEPTLSIPYDPLQADPDYLVTGQWEIEWGLYQPWIDSGDFRLIKEFPGYHIYERVRD
jgi:hypothetical protein